MMPASEVGTPFWFILRAKVDDSSEKAQQVSPVPAKNADSGEAMVLMEFTVWDMILIIKGFLKNLYVERYNKEKNSQVFRYFKLIKSD